MRLTLQNCVHVFVFGTKHLKIVLEVLFCMDGRVKPASYDQDYGKGGTSIFTPAEMRPLERVAKHPNQEQT